jgi:Ca2+-transporting ATPase
LITDGLPALALVLDRPDPDALRRPPRALDEAMIGRAEWKTVLTTGLVLAATTFGVFRWTVGYGGLELARVLTFTTLIFGHTIMTLAFRNRSKTLWQVGPFSNPFLLAVIAGSLVAQVLVTLSRFGKRVFHLADASPRDLMLAALLGLLPVTVLETLKIWRARQSARQGTTNTGRP